MSEQTIDCKVLNSGRAVRVTLGAGDWRTAKQYRITFTEDGEVERVQAHRGHSRIGWTTLHTRGPLITIAIDAARQAVVGQ